MPRKKDWDSDYLRGMEDARYIISLEADKRGEERNFESELVLRRAVEKIDKSFKDEAMKEMLPERTMKSDPFKSGKCECGGPLYMHGHLKSIPPKIRYKCADCGHTVDQKQE